MLRIITDFDGPIMDVSERYYQVYRFCLELVGQPGQPIHTLSKAEFWALKRSQTPERQIGQISGLDEAQSLEFARIRRQTVHTIPYLSYDVPVKGAIATLEKIHQTGIELVTMTMRRVRELDNALTRYNLGRFFADDRRYCLANDYVKTNDVSDKTQLMGRAIAELPKVSDTWMVGDTEADILSAKANGIPVIGVLSGIRDRTQLQQHQPDWIVNNLGEAFEVILSESASLRTGS
ncbi:MAG: HAD family hydrolase [Oculatellaceae cyanobacterium Prado106]|nr:HAD family hydrolase [Oculatellaceae cyanobacterium Prado106]